ncbi:nitroreductase family deazaflavin-dependent oxidoreductase [Amycolatopsis sp. 195334CR]|uniref:nitroreductase family deazaflavin-dependent oxidoreductase n=1 Tax=Amycolatopsis sp. 195334CR TaxID=2814588 RepID=UPI001A8FB277|nr:nitroreductase family deazaflavin-dependent oxidoreductase [Amycolatopsis sp. 195334CR]MBN6038532.1 nitroreductase family deazaflavin-dependent oxidoreductase [Amycolatopsis sp. 195334CR]
MALFDSLPTGLLRIAFRGPVWLYRMRLGSLLGRRFVYVAHRGRSSGLRRETVVEVVGLDDTEVFVVSGYGERADWYRNLQAAPALEIRLAGHRYQRPAQRFLTREQTVELLSSYRRRHPRTWRRLASAFSLPAEPTTGQLDNAAERLRSVAFTLDSVRSPQGA